MSNEKLLALCALDPRGKVTSAYLKEKPWAFKTADIVSY